MALQRTFSILKPDVTRRNLTGAVNAKIEAAGLRIVAQKRVHMTRAEAETFYAVHKERPFFGELVEFMTSAPVVVQVLEGNQDFGPAFVVDVLKQGEKVNQPIILFRTANFDPAEDWSISFQGTVADFFVAGLVDAATALHYGCNAATTGFGGGTCNTYPNLDAFEIEYAPFGVDSGLCMGVAATAFQDEGVTLQPCGVSSKTVWIVDGQVSDPNSVGDPNPDVQGSPGELPGFVPLINGSNTNFSHPFVLTYPNGAFPTDKPRAQITVQNLTGFQQPGPPFFPIVSTVSSNQLWNSAFGVNP